MTREKIKQLWPVLEAFRDGKVIQVKSAWSGRWVEITHPSWDAPIEEYRIKPEPMHVWLNLYENGDRFVHESRAAAEAALRARNKEGRTVRFTEDPEP